MQYIDNDDDDDDSEYEFDSNFLHYAYHMYVKDCKKRRCACIWRAENTIDRLFGSVLDAVDGAGDVLRRNLVPHDRRFGSVAA